MITRRGEEPRKWIRGSRYFQVGNDYYFCTREGTNVGPFESVSAAERGFSLYLQYLKEGKSAELCVSTITNKDPWDKAHFR